MPLTREEKIVCVNTYLVKNHSKLYKQHFAGTLTEQLATKNLIHRLVHKSQAPESVNNLKNNAENPRSGRMLTPR